MAMHDSIPQSPPLPTRWNLGELPDHAAPDANGDEAASTAAEKPKASKRRAKPKHMMKTWLCKHYMNGYCRYEEQCAYAHGEADLLARPDLSKTKMCANFLSGNCSSDLCTFAHDYLELRPQRFTSSCSAQESLSTMSSSHAPSLHSPIHGSTYPATPEPPQREEVHQYPIRRKPPANQVFRVDPAEKEQDAALQTLRKMADPRFEFNFASVPPATVPSRSTISMATPHRQQPEARGNTAYEPQLSQEGRQMSAIEEWYLRQVQQRVPEQQLQLKLPQRSTQQQQRVPEQQLQLKLPQRSTQQQQQLCGRPVQQQQHENISAGSSTMSSQCSSTNASDVSRLAKHLLNMSGYHSSLPANDCEPPCPLMQSSMQVRQWGDIFGKVLKDWRKKELMEGFQLIRIERCEDLPPAHQAMLSYICLRSPSWKRIFPELFEFWKEALAEQVRRQSGSLAFDDSTNASLFPWQ
eukprot:gnl/TRDRNA2_/TRDRNA2_27511_c0_seq1.p1 gnl/TRDRNA2_/TRDRNA2_27511_c0~~gnl/TRDRNA2_/TRDRNA2_27511_c0_seq1.p1  ORF type:complete len:490 (-),score=68.05 gnl/TRDRNA2_/TRDRNA2_27511_c0_seq1:156-1553(-)